MRLVLLLLEHLCGEFGLEFRDAIGHIGLCLGLREVSEEVVLLLVGAVVRRAGRG